MNIQAYFERISYSGDTAPTLANLRSIHRAHLLAVPFENLDIHLGRKILLDEAALFEKIVSRRRGGFCYEQNGLFAAVLRQMGYEVTLLEARVANANGELGIRFDHLTLLVMLAERWLADVGFGDSFMEPLRFDDPAEQDQDGSVFRVEHDGTKGVHSRRSGEGTWHDEYHFFLQPRRLSDFSDGCTYHQTSPDSHFTQKRLCSIATPSGRITLSGRRLIVTENGERRERTIRSDDEFGQLLQTHFGIEL